jgi:hypothetical protein
MTFLNQNSTAAHADVKTITLNTLNNLLPSADRIRVADSIMFMLRGARAAISFADKSDSATDYSPRPPPPTLPASSKSADSLRKLLKVGDKTVKKGAAAKLAVVANYLDILSNLSTFLNIHPTLLTNGVLDMLLDFARKAAKDPDGSTILKVFKVEASHDATSRATRSLSHLTAASAASAASASALPA